MSKEFDEVIGHEMGRSWIYSVYIDQDDKAAVAGTSNVITCESEWRGSISTARE